MKAMKLLGVVLCVLMLLVVLLGGTAPVAHAQYNTTVKIDSAVQDYANNQQEFVFTVWVNTSVAQYWPSCTVTAVFDNGSPTETTPIVPPTSITLQNNTAATVSIKCDAVTASIHYNGNNLPGYYQGEADLSVITPTPTTLPTATFVPASLTPTATNTVPPTATATATATNTATPSHTPCHIVGNKCK